MSYRLWPAQLTAATVVVLLGAASRLPQAPEEEKLELAKRFHFTRLALPATDTPTDVDVHPVNPSVEHIARWLSSVGTSLTLGDIDEDGLANDFCAVEPRTGEVRVAPVPGTGDRYPLFVLRTDPPMDPDRDVATGCKVGDFNEDGLADLLVHYVGRTPMLFLRKAGTNPQQPALADFTVQPLVAEDQPWWTSTILQTDVDGDGHLDLVVANYFPDGQQIFGADATGPVTMHNTFARARNGGTNRIYLWQSATAGEVPSARYAEVPNPFSDDDATAWTLALGAADLDGDGLDELYFANDFGPDVLYANRSTPGQVKLLRLHGKSGFNTPTSRVLGNDSFKGMGVDFGDINGDGRFDIFVSNITVHGGLEESHFLFLSGEGDMDAGEAPYVDRGEELGVSRSSWAWDTRLADFDNDGELELMQATGFLKGKVNWWADLAEFANGNDVMVSDPANWPDFPEGIDISGHDAEPFYVKGKDGRYVDICGPVGFDGEWNSRGLALADADGDGDLDLALANQWEDSWFFRNDAENENRSLGLHLRIDPAASGAELLDGLSDPARSWPAIGARATVTLPDGRTLVREVDGGNGHSGASAAELNFGLGAIDPNQSLPVSVRWRGTDGALQEVNLTLSPGVHTLHLAASRS